MIPKIFKILAVIMISMFVFSIAQVIIFKYVNPPITYLMVKRKYEHRDKPLKKKWVHLEEVSKPFLVTVLLGEDSTFFRHKGILWKSFRSKVVKKLKNPFKNPIYGESTISQQTAKNVFLFPNKGLMRKALEVYYTLLIEWIWGKKRILEVYINVIELSKNIYGIEAASNEFFHKSSKDLEKEESICLVSTFPNPRKYDVRYLTPYQKTREYILSRRFERESSRILRDIKRGVK